MRERARERESERERVVLLQRRENATELLRFPAHKYSQGPQLYNKSIASDSNTHTHTHIQAEKYTHATSSLHVYTQIKKHTSAKYADACCQNINQQSQHYINTSARPAERAAGINAGTVADGAGGKSVWKEGRKEGRKGGKMEGWMDRG